LSWSSFIHEAGSAEHGVQIYAEIDELAESVADFLVAGLTVGDPAIVIASGEHWPVFTRALVARGCDVATLEQESLINFRDAAETLEALLAGGLPSRERFEAIVGGLVDEVAARFPGRTIRAFGEMVDLLWRRRDDRAALALEALWNELQQTRDFALLCGYQIDIFDREAQRRPLSEVFHAHTHNLPAADSARLAAAVDQALTEIVGPLGTARIYLDVAENVPRTSLPRAQAILSWLSTAEAPAASRILERARTHYSRSRQAA
jgi:MEDS: MEthanogen/methylotroph, DcmR Sensory domain